MNIWWEKKIAGIVRKHLQDTIEEEMDDAICDTVTDDGIGSVRAIIKRGVEHVVGEVTHDYFQAVWVQLLIEL